MVFSRRYITHLGTKLIILAGELSSSVVFSNTSLAPPFIHEASTTLCQCRRWAEHLRQAQADILAVSYPAVAFPVTSCGVFSTQPKPLLLAIAAQFPCPWDTGSAPECTALVLNSQVKSLSPFFIISKGWISCGAGSVETQAPFHNIRNTFSKQSGVKTEGERQWDTRVPHWRQLSLRKSPDRYGSTTTWQKWNKNKTKKVFLFCFDASIKIAQI